jgi:hypothetical protein
MSRMRLVKSDASFIARAYYNRVSVQSSFDHIAASCFLLGAGALGPMRVGKTAKICCHARRVMDSSGPRSDFYCLAKHPGNAIHQAPIIAEPMEKPAALAVLHDGGCKLQSGHRALALCKVSAMNSSLALSVPHR